MSGSCPVCGVHDLHHSRLRTFGEKLRSNFTRKVPFRCHACGWRGWREDVSAPVESIRGNQTVADADLDQLDPHRDPDDDGPIRR